MTDPELKSFAKLRLAVGCAGERAIPAWWKSDFCSQQSDAFLAPVFPRSLWAARIHAVSDAASRVHDEHIGVGQRVFHLFRLPESLEQPLAHLLQDDDFSSELAAVIASDASPITHIEDMAKSTKRSSTSGPFRVGSASSLLEEATLPALAAAYRDGFADGEPVFPFFDDRA